MKLAIATSPHVLLLGLLMLALAPSAQGELIGHWKLDENGQKDLVADSSTNGLHGTFSAATAEHSVDGGPGDPLPGGRVRSARPTCSHTRQADRFHRLDVDPVRRRAKSDAAVVLRRNSLASPPGGSQ